MGAQPLPPRIGGWTAAAVAGFAYFGVIFSLGFALGAIRNLVVAPLVGEVSAVSLEAPLMLAASWLVCGWILRTFAVDHRTGPRVAMAVTAFVLLMVAEAAVGALLFARDPMTLLQVLRTPAGLIGLASQIGFAVAPLIRQRRAIG